MFATLPGSVKVFALMLLLAAISVVIVLTVRVGHGPSPEGQISQSAPLLAGGLSPNDTRPVLAAAVPDEALVSSRTPSIVPVTPKGWDAPILIYSKDAKGAIVPPSVDLPTYVRVAYGNVGLSSSVKPFTVDLYLDGVLVASYRGSELLAGEQVLTPEWNGLPQVVQPVSGPHTLTLVVNAGELADTSLSNGSVAARSFHWAIGIPAPEGSGPAKAVSVLPLVQPFTPPQWDGPVVVSQVAGIFSSPDILDSEKLTYVHWAVRNPSSQAPSGPYVVSLRLDGESLAEWERPGLRPGGVDVVMDWPLFWAGSHRFLGPHRLTVNVKPVGEDARTRAKGVFRDFVWDQSPPRPSREPRRYTADVLIQRVESLERLLTASEQQLASSAVVARQLLDIADAVYYQLYNRSLYDEDLAVHLLSDPGYETWVMIECSDRAATLGLGIRGQYGVACGQLAGSAGYTGFWRSHPRIVLRSERPAAQVLLALAHELGHFRQSLLRPDLDAQAGSLGLYALREAQAYAHEALFLRTLEEMLGRPLLLYPHLDGFNRFVDESIVGLIVGKDSSEHARGRLLLWLALLSDPNLAQQRAELLRLGHLSGSGVRGVLAYLMAFSPRDVDRYGERRLLELDRYLPTIVTMVKSRLVPELPSQAEGSPAFREVGLLSP